MKYVTLKEDSKYINSTFLRILKECNLINEIKQTLGDNLLLKLECTIDNLFIQYDNFLNGLDNCVYNEYKNDTRYINFCTFFKLEYKDKKNTIDRCIEMQFGEIKKYKCYEIDIDDINHLFFIHLFLIVINKHNGYSNNIIIKMDNIIKYFSTIYKIVGKTIIIPEDASNNNM